MGRQRLVIVFVCVLAGCGGSPVADPFVGEERVWPEPPETKRIAFVGEFSSSADLGIEASAWSRFISFTAGANVDSMIRPMAVTTSADSRVILVADPDARCVHRYDLDTGRYSCLTISSHETLVSPIGLTVSLDGRIYIADSRLAAIFHADLRDKHVRKFETSVELEQPTGIAWDDAQDLLFVTDTGSQSIKIFDGQGGLVGEIGARGNGPGEFNFPTYLWIDSRDELFVTDSLNFRIQRFGDAGEFLHQFGKNGDRVGDFARPKGVATDAFGHVYVVDALLSAMQVFNRDGDFLIAIGQQGQGPGQFWLPNGIYVSADNSIYIADSRNRRVQVFRYVGPEE